MKIQDFSFNGLKVTVGTKSVTHAPTNGRSKSNMPHQLFQSWGHKKACDFRTSTFVSLSDINISLTVQYDENCIPWDEGSLHIHCVWLCT